MINELRWDSNFFRKKIGELSLSGNRVSGLNTVLEKARDDGFQYIICKIKSQETRLIRALESAGFYLLDIGITWWIDTGDFLHANGGDSTTTEKSVQVATTAHIPLLRKMMKSLFLESRFYNDPFLSRAEADRLYQAWIENSVKGLAADKVFWIPGEGFVTCRKKGRAGEIVLIGIRQRSRGKGRGTVLMKKAMEWFILQGLESVTVRTQLKNIKAMNFYLKLGFSMKGYDIVLGKIL